MPRLGNSIVGSSTFSLFHRRHQHPHSSIPGIGTFLSWTLFFVMMGSPRAVQGLVAPLRSLSFSRRTNKIMMRSNSPFILSSSVRRISSSSSSRNRLQQQSGSSSRAPFWLLSTALGATIVSSSSSSTLENNNGDSTNTWNNSSIALKTAVAHCSPAVNDSTTPTTSRRRNGDDHEKASTTTTTHFPEELLHHDHYNGITLHLDQLNNSSDNNSNDSIPESLLDPATFEAQLKAALAEWKAQGKKGIWIHCPVEHAALVPIATRLGFDFHMVHNKQTLVLSQWLPTDTTNKLPLGPTHQVGVGCIVLCPWDKTRMLVVQEKTGPAARWKLWKMPTGLSDPGEDLHRAAERELHEETGLTANCDGILVFRQAHSSRSGTRASSDLFFVCQMTLQLPEGFVVPTSSTTNNGENDETNDTTSSQQLFQACPDEIAAIRWMPVREYCDQERWQTSPVYQQLNRVIWQAAQQQQQQQSSQSPDEVDTPNSQQQQHWRIHHETLPLGLGISKTATNTIYYPRQSNL
mmetsp:Transcript_20175/g.55697  ORF Transcript_20175/g.55697 Transcript_20175/m.55697 type:complete len:520 (+) Transcript_20175:634-2193(+)